MVESYINPQGSLIGTTSDHGTLQGLADDDHSQYVHISTARTVSAAHVYTGGPFFQAAAGSGAFFVLVSGDTVARLTANGSGALSWGSGSATRDAYLFRQAANVLAFSTDGTNVDGTAYTRTLKIKNQGAGSDPTLTSNSSVQRLSLTGDFQIGGGAVYTGTVIAPGTSGLKIGNATTEKLGFYGTTTIVQPSTIANPSGGITQDAEARAAITSILNVLRASSGGLGLIA